VVHAELRQHGGEAVPAITPPSTSRLAPLTKLASSAARKAKALAPAPAVRI